MVEPKIRVDAILGCWRSVNQRQDVQLAAEGAVREDFAGRDGEAAQVGC
jgi:hypothetical protein